MTVEHGNITALSCKGLTAQKLRALVRYEPETGKFFRLAAPCRKAGKMEGREATQSVNDNGYAIVSLGQYWRFRAHRLAWLYMTGEWPAYDIDHINGNRVDNRWCNLRAATRSQNVANARLAVDNITGFKGITYDRHRNKWQARITVNGRTTYLGRYTTKEDAAAAYANKFTAIFGEYARLA